MTYNRKFLIFLFVKKMDPTQATSLNLSLTICAKFFLVEGLNYFDYGEIFFSFNEI